jgi:hypothetical protein
MQPQTVQPQEKWESGQILLKAVRRTALSSSQSKDGISEDIALDLRYMGRDLVRNVFGGRDSDRQSDGKYVDIVSKTGQKFRVFTRVIRKNSGGSLVATVSPTELSPINFSHEQDKPDSVILVTINPRLKSASVFDFPLERQEGPKVTKESYNVCWSEKKQSYGKAQGNLLYSYQLIEEGSSYTKVR